MKKVVGILLGSSIALAFGLPTQAVTIDEETRQVHSDATIQVNGGGSVVTPPEEEDKPSGKTDQTGPLSIDQVIVFNFKEMNLSGNTQRISLQNDGTNSLAKRNIQVTDTRGTGAGWNLQIKQSELTDTTTSTGETRTLKGAYIALNNAAVVAGDHNTAVGNATLHPSMISYEADAGNKNSFQKIMVAEKMQGMGTFKAYYNQGEQTDDIQLVVPSGSYAGAYHGTVTWALSDGPEVNPAKPTTK